MQASQFSPTAQSSSSSLPVAIGLVLLTSSSVGNAHVPHHLPIAARNPYQIALLQYPPLVVHLFIQSPVPPSVLVAQLTLRMAIGFSTRSLSSKLGQLFDCFMRPVLQRSAPIQGFLVSLALFSVNHDLPRSSPTVWRQIQGHPMRKSMEKLTFLMFRLAYSIVFCR